MALISYSKKFIFVHVYKCAGSSMKEALLPYCKPTQVEKIKKKLGLQQKIYEFESFVPQHPTALEIRQQLSSKVYKNSFKFAFVRNPWDLEVSLYNYMLQNEKHRQHKLIRELASFDRYIEWRVSEDLHSQSRYVLDTEDNLIVDFVGKFENLEQDFEQICRKIHVSTNLPHINKSNRGKYSDVYTSHSKKMVEKFFEKDIELFNYSF